ncbi:hypothetical protein [Chitinimonas lacunae]|uniref:Uncharacterized protein n=1 Tax=Chitinimonas lacunae TaxID=1963018 RepID=A0ABV8MIS0_9NEIS
MNRRFTTIALALTLVGLGPLAQAAEPSPAPMPVPLQTHSIWTNKSLYLVDPTIDGSRTASGSAATAWTNNTRNGYFRVAAKANGYYYEFVLASISSSSFDQISGVWDIRRNGVLVCDGCIGKAYGLSGAVGNYFKIYVGDPDSYAEKWHYSAYIQYRFDF